MPPNTTQRPGSASPTLDMSGSARPVDEDFAPGPTEHPPPPPPSPLDDALRRAHAQMDVDLDDPRMWGAKRDHRCALARRAGVDERRSDDIAELALRDPDRFQPNDLRCWKIASPTWLALADQQLAPLEHVERPVGLLVVVAALREGWQLMPVLSLDAIRVIAALGGRVERGLRDATVPLAAIDAQLERINHYTLHAGGRDALDSGRRLGEQLTRVLERPCTPGVPKDARDRWGRLLVSRLTHTGPDGTSRGELHLRVLTFAGRGFTQRRLGSAPRDQYRSQARAWTSARPSRPPSTAGYRCCCPPRPPRTSATRCASGA